MRILILGHANHGKTTTAMMLRRYGFKVVDTSDLNIDRYIQEELAKPTPKGVPKTPSAMKKQILENKDAFRQKLFDSLREYTKDEPDKFAKYVLQKSDVYVGMRSYEEFKASEYLFDLVLHVHDYNKPEESRESYDLQDHLSSVHTPLYTIDTTSATHRSVRRQLDVVMCQYFDLNMSELRHLIALTAPHTDGDTNWVLRETLGI